MRMERMIAELPEMKAWLSQPNDQRLLVVGMNGSLKILGLEALLDEKQQPMIVYVSNDYHARQLVDEWESFSKYPIHLFPVNDVFSAEMAISSPENMVDRIRALDFLQSGAIGAVVTTVAGATHYLPTVKQWQEAHVTFQTGKAYEHDALLKQLQMMGYHREPQVEKPGDYSVRGSLIDIFPLTFDHPIRLDFFDTELDTIRYFDEMTQRSIVTVEDVVIPPASDLILTEAQYEHASQTLEKELAKAHDANMDDLTYMENIYQQWLNGVDEEAQRFVSYFYKAPQTIQDYAAPNIYTVVDDVSRLYEMERQLDQEIGEWQVQQLDERHLLHEVPVKASMRDVIKKLKQATFLAVLQKGMGNMKFDAIASIQYQTMQQFFGQLPLLKTELDRYIARKQTVILTVSNEEKRQKLNELLEEMEMTAVLTDADHIQFGEIQMIVHSLQHGFMLPDSNVAVITEREIFESVQKKRRRRRSPQMSNAERLKSYNELQPGDYVVHVNHGIGKYIGMETIDTAGVHQDYMTILYRNDDKLFIPVTQLNLIQKYVAQDGTTPRLNTLNGKEWHKTKQKVASQIEDIADDLINLYAAREAEKGFAFSPDGELQREFEDAFPYVETEDQLRSAEEIKRDMEKDRPMDRLLVGDVGFGKTEVALRAVFKAVADHKQVAFLVPTTILAQQHFETMKRRFADFPVNIGILNRFCTTKEKNETLEALAEGKLDVIVGTHRILSKDVKFNNLGLLVIDEEQRFGVKHKERLKELKHQVDVLTLTATPIPRTLHMSMLGVRDLSVLETPPADRYPVQTYVMEYNAGAIKEATEREIARGGQVFYLYNRVDTIEEKVHELQQLMPDIRIAYAHGQMHESQLEGVLMEFLEGEYDMLVTTTIIETGVDMPNVNTLFVDHADHMGLSQLYQLRGRVGRSHRIAYAYFMYEPMKVLSESSEQKLEAIKEFTALGSGFKIAMRDLSIRGAGNLLGKQQSGFINSVGFDLYSDMLQEAIQRKRGENIKRTSDVTIRLDVDAYIPTDYLHAERLKLEMYKRIREAVDQQTLDDLEDEMIDRFGEYPDEVSYLFMIARMKVAAMHSGIQSIEQKQTKLHIALTPEASSLYRPEQYLEALNATKLKARFDPSKGYMQLIFQLHPFNTAQWIQEIWQFLQALEKEAKASGVIAHES